MERENEINCEIHLICKKDEGADVTIIGDTLSILTALALLAEDVKALNIPKESILNAFKLGLEEENNADKTEEEKMAEEILRKIFG